MKSCKSAFFKTEGFFRVSASRSQGCEFKSQPGQTKDLKTGTHCLPAKHSAIWEGVRVNGENQG